MLSQTPSNKNKIVNFLILVIVLALVTLIMIFIWNRNKNTRGGNPNSGMDDHATIKIEKFSHSSIEDGKTQWILNADTASYIENKNQAVLKNLQVVFFVDNGKPLNLTADHGILQIDTNDITVFGNVRLKTQDMELKTEKLHYDHKKRIIFSKQPVQVTDKSFLIKADTLIYDLNDQDLIFEGRVDSTIYETIF